MDLNSRILVTGSSGLVGSAIKRYLDKSGYRHILSPKRSELNLLDTKQVNSYFETQKPEYVFLSAARVGGIHANNTYPADFIVENLRIQLNVFESAHKTEVKKLLFTGSSCIYPKLAKQPISEDQLLTGPLELTNIAYAVSKIAGIITAQAFNQQYSKNFISVMPTNLYGINDNYHGENSHVIPALIRRIHEAKVRGKKTVIIWGTGTPKREFLSSDDLAEACVFLMQNYNSSEIINIGSGQEVSIKELAQIIKDVIKYEGDLEFDATKPDGTPRKLLDCSKINALGWQAHTSLKTGIELAYKDFLQKIDSQ